MKKHLTDTVADRARCPAGKRQEIIRDTELRGFLLRVGQTGNTFCFELKRDGKSVRTTIGDAAAWSVADAREKARELRRAADRGEDIAAKPRLLSDAWRRCEEEHLPELRPHTQTNYEYNWRRYIEPALAAKRLDAIKRDDVRALHRSMAATPYQANRVLAQLRALLNLAITEWEWLDQNVASGVKSFTETPREDYLKPHEVAAVFEHLPDSATGDCIRILLQTGARPSEVYRMRWADIDLPGRRWTKPASATKQKRAHHAVLSDPVCEIISRQKCVGPYVFTGRHGGHLRNASYVWHQTLRAAGLPHHRLYDARHSVASALASAGVDLYAIGKHLGHANPKTTARYSHLFEDRQREVADIVSFPPRKTAEGS